MKHFLLATLFCTVCIVAKATPSQDLTVEIGFKSRDRFLRETLASMRQTTGQNESDMVSLSCEVHYPWDWRGYLVIVTFSERDNTVTWQGRPVQTVRLTRSDIVALIPQGDESKDSRELHVSRQSGKFSLFSDILVSSGVCEEPGTNPLF